MQSKHRYLHRLYHKWQHRNTNVNNSSNTRFNYHIIHNLSEYTGCFTMRMMTQIYLGTAIEKKLKKTTPTNYKKKKELTQRSGLTRIYLFVFRSAQQIIKKDRKFSCWSLYRIMGLTKVQTFVANLMSLRFRPTSSVALLNEASSLSSSVRRHFLCMLFTLLPNFAISSLKRLIYKMLIITEIKWEESIIMSRKSYKIIVKESQGIFKDSQSVNTTTGKKTNLIIFGGKNIFAILPLRSRGISES